MTDSALRSRVQASMTPSISPSFRFLSAGVANRLSSAKCGVSITSQSALNCRSVSTSMATHSSSLHG